MATKRTNNVRVTRVGGETETITGDFAQGILSDFESYVATGEPYGLRLPGDEDGTYKLVSMRCICEVEKLADTTEEVPGRPCNDPGCNFDYDPEPAPAPLPED